MLWHCALCILSCVLRALYVALRELLSELRRVAIAQSAQLDASVCCVASNAGVSDFSRVAVAAVCGFC